jgi:hypothetical protein
MTTLVQMLLSVVYSTVIFSKALSLFGSFGGGHTARSDR